MYDGCSLRKAGAAVARYCCRLTSRRCMAARYQGRARPTLQWLSKEFRVDDGLDVELTVLARCTHVASLAREPGGCRCGRTVTFPIPANL